MLSAGAGGSSSSSSSSSQIRSSRSPALPDFVFNPGASLPSTPGHPFLSPPQSPLSPRAIPIRRPGGGHGRSGSEFIGGNPRSGEAFTFISTSPTKSESGLASPLLSPLNSPTMPPGSKPSGPPHGRRGHAHRRSAAISSHDLSVILQPTNGSAPPRGNSAPSSPSGFSHLDNKTYAFPEKSVSDNAKAHSEGMEPSRATNANDLPQPDVAPGPEPVESSQHTPYASRPVNRARVGFSDTLEFIPRPLSLVSSDTSSTVTVRMTSGGGSANHSVSGSISSIISLNASIAAGVEREGLSPLARSPSRNTVTESRPSTAGAVLDRTQSIVAEDADGVAPRRRNSNPLMAPVPPPEDVSTASPEVIAQGLPSPNKTPKRWSFFGLEPFIGSSSAISPTRSSAQNVSSTDESSQLPMEPADAHRPYSLDQGQDRKIDLVNVMADDDASPLSRTVSRKSSSKKKKKVKTWGILSRKTKPRRKSRRAPTPPPIFHPTADSDDESSIEAQPADGQTPKEPATDALASPPVVLVTPFGSPSEPRDASPSWQPMPSPSLSLPDDDAAFPMIDLDAALGPFNTPLPRNAEWEAAQRAGGLSKRQLHSAAGMSRFTGPGMHYSHRRAESAPEMPPFNRVGIPRFSSSSAMADVFEEEEEEEDGKQMEARKPQSSSGNVSVFSASSTASTPSRQPSESLERPPSIDIRVTSIDGDEEFSYERPVDFSSAISDDATSSAALSRRGSGLSGLSDDDKTQPSTCLKSEYSASSLHDEVIDEEEANTFSFDDGCEVVMESSSDSTVRSPGRLMKGKDLAPVDVSPLHLPTANSLAPISPYSMTPSSVFPSPRSPMSYDANRVSTAPSSVTDDNFQSLLLGEPGPDVRISSDIPSLTSSNSTMTRDSVSQPVSNFPPGPQPRPYLASRGNDRPASFTSTAFGRRRSSLASLQRLISTSHGERSKLSIEVQPDNASTTSVGDPEKQRPKASKTKRLSRMMQFWKGKDESTA